MPIYAYSDVGLHHFTDLLHDLYFALPGKDLKPVDGRIHITFKDEEKIICDDRISEFEVCVCDVLEVKLDGRPEDCPDPVQMNKLKYKAKEKTVVFEAVHPIQIRIKVEKLHLELNQLV